MSRAGAPADSLHGLAFEEAIGHAYRYLGSRDRTVAEVRRHLARRGAGEELAGECVRELCRQGYLDDARFARRFAEDRRRLDGWGSQRIRRRLLELGVAEELADAAGGDPAGEDERSAAVEVLRERRCAREGDERARTRALGLLLRRGFSTEVAYDAVRAYEREG